MADKRVTHVLYPGLPSHPDHEIAARQMTGFGGMVCIDLGGDYPELYPAYRHLMARDPGLKIHLYGKQVRPGRKIGHVNVSGDDLDDLRERAAHAADYLNGAVTE